MAVDHHWVIGQWTIIRDSWMVFRSYARLREDLKETYFNGPGKQCLDIFGPLGNKQLKAIEELLPQESAACLLMQRYSYKSNPYLHKTQNKLPYQNGSTMFYISIWRAIGQPSTMTSFPPPGTPFSPQCTDPGSLRSSGRPL